MYCNAHQSVNIASGKLLKKSKISLSDSRLWRRKTIKSKRKRKKRYRRRRPPRSLSVS